MYEMPRIAIKKQKSQEITDCRESYFWHCHPLLYPMPP